MMQAMMNANSHRNAVHGGSMTTNANTMPMNPNAAMASGIDAGTMVMGMTINQSMLPQQPQMNQFGAMPMGSLPSISIPGQNGVTATSSQSQPGEKDPFAQFGMNAFR